jgi:hypothetical protein
MGLRVAASAILAAILCSGQAQPTDEDRDISVKKLVPNIVEDQASIWLFPRKLADRRDLISTAAFIVAGSALVVGADPPVARYFRNTAAFNGFNRALPGTATSAAILSTPLVLYGAGLVRKDSKMTATALLAGLQMPKYSRRY